jgi:hypothetical protein
VCVGCDIQHLSRCPSGSVFFGWQKLRYIVRQEQGENPSGKKTPIPIRMKEKKERKSYKVYESFVQ